MAINMIKVTRNDNDFVEIIAYYTQPWHSIACVEYEIPVNCTCCSKVTYMLMGLICNSY